MSYCVIIPSYNRPELLQRALASVLGQTLPPEKVFIVIDEPEDQVKYEFLKAYSPQVEMSFSGGGKGPAAVRNIGLEKVNSEFVFFLDDDDEWISTKAEQQVYFLQVNLMMVGVTCWRYLVYPDDKIVNKRVSAEEINSTVNIRNLTGSPSFFGYRVNEKTKGIRFDEKIWGSEDMDFYMQLAPFGLIGVVEEYLANYYEHSGAQLSKQFDKTILNLSYMLNKHQKKISISDYIYLRALQYGYESGMCRSQSKYRFYQILFSIFTAMSLKNMSNYKKHRKRVIHQANKYRKKLLKSSKA